MERPKCLAEVRNVILEAPLTEAFRHFLCLVKTVDEHDPGELKPFPIYPYLLTVADAMITEPVLYIEKSRQMLTTLLGCARVLFHAIRFPGSRIFIQSKREVDACSILWQRIKPMGESLPPGFFEHFKCKGERRDGRVIVTRKSVTSTIFAIPEGPEKIRSYTCSGGFIDEAAFQPGAAEAISAAMPAIASSSGKGGWLLIVSTPNGKEPGFYRNIYGVAA